MANFNLFNNLVKEIPTNLRRFIARKLKRFHVIPRAHKVVEKTVIDRGERAPLPECIQKQIDQALKNKPELLKEVSSEQNESLLERLKKVFVSSIGENKDMFDKRRLTPIQYNLFKPDVIEEYKENIPEGKFSLKQAEIFLQQFKRNPDIETVEELSEKLKIESKTIMCMLTHTKIFKAVAPIHKKSENKSLFQRTVEFMVPSIIETEPDEEKMYQLLDRRQIRFKQYYEEKLGIKQEDFAYQFKNPAVHKVLVNLNIVEDKQASVKKSIPEEKDDVTVTPDADKRGHLMTTDGKTTTILVSDLKPGEDPNAWEGIPDFQGPERFGRKLLDHGSGSREVQEKIFYPSDYKFDVFKVMEEQDRKARIEAKRLKRLQQKPEEQNSERKPEDEQRKVTIPEKISSENT